MSTNPASKKIPQYGKLDLEECIKNFRILVLNNLNDIPRLKTDLITSGKLSHCDKTFIRAFCWKVFLNVLTLNEKASLKLWIDETMNQRKNVKKMIRNNTINKLKGDPLRGITSKEKENSGGWDDFLTQSETMKLIKYDVERTMPNEKLFQEIFIKEMETTILTNFAKIHKKIAYRQGMNEILALIIYAMFPYYTKSPNAKYTPELIDKWTKNPTDNAKEIYCFFHDESEFESDIYCLFENLMIKFGLIKFFEDEPKDNDAISSYFIKRIRNIITRKLSIQDRAIYSHFQNQNLDYSLAFHRWFKCLFKREFPEPDVCLIWDYIFAHEAEKNTGMFLYIDYIAIGMIINVKYQLLSRDSSGIFQILMNYPRISPITNLLSMADQIAEDLAMPPEEQPPKIEEKKEEEKKIEETTTQPQPQPQPQVQTTMPNPLGQINPLLMNPNLLVNPNANNLQPNPMNNLMLAMVMQQMANQQLNNNVNIINTANTVTNPNPNQGEVSAASALIELKGIVNKYQNVLSVEDKNRMDFLIDSLAKKF